MSTLIVSDDRFLDHDPGPGHPESPARLNAITRALTAANLSGVTWRRAAEGDDAHIAAVHQASHMERLRSVNGRVAALDEDTQVSAGSYRAARLAAGAAVSAVTSVWQGEHKNAFVLCRPPGHHAEASRPMGFCLFNNVAIAAQAARDLGAERVLIVDWDVHHGNGTQHIFEHRSDVLFLSAHQHPLYPGTGACEEVGLGSGVGFTGNCALPAGQTDADYGAVFHEVFLPIAAAFCPDIILVSAGFDAHAADPLGDMKVTERGYAAMTSALLEAASSPAKGRLVLLLEGGYNLDALGASVAACTETLSGGRRESFPTGSLNARSTVKRCRDSLGSFWRLP